MSKENIVGKHSLLSADARNRALRTFIQGIGIDIGLAVAFVLYNVFNNADDWNDVDLRVLAFLLVKSVLIAGASYVMRRYLDKSSVPTPLPPTPQPAPADPTPNV